jgi:hypothetical protein
MRPGPPIRTSISAGLIGSGSRVDRRADRGNTCSVSTAPSDCEPENAQGRLQTVRGPSNVEPDTDNCDLAQENRERFISQTLNVFQRRSPRSLAREDARQISENIARFFEILMEWDARSGKGESAKNS